jgi:hypothetical protein
MLEPKRPRGMCVRAVDSRGASGTGSGALVVQRDGTDTALGPPSRDLVLSANGRFVGEPDSIVWSVQPFSRAIVSRRAGKLLKFSIAPSA